jgi:tRNA 2-thiouridine synthesizing protein D
MQYSILVTAGPEEPGALTALDIAIAVLGRGHDLYRVFFYREGVRLAGLAPASASAERWQALVLARALNATVCSGASARRGLFEHDQAHLAPGFELAGLGLWVDALSASDRILCFGA